MGNYQKKHSQKANQKALENIKQVELAGQILSTAVN